MTIFNLAFIMMLFAYWIWLLKQDIERLQGKLHLTGSGGEAATEEKEQLDHSDIQVSQQRQSSHTMARKPELARRSRGSNGVQTWTIEAVPSV